jgi:hypothetical protein
LQVHDHDIREERRHLGNRLRTIDRFADDLDGKKSRQVLAARHGRECSNA